MSRWNKNCGWKALSSRCEGLSKWTACLSTNFAEKQGWFLVAVISLRGCMYKPDLRISDIFQRILSINCSVPCFAQLHQPTIGKNIMETLKKTVYEQYLTHRSCSMLARTQLDHCTLQQNYRQATRETASQRDFAESLQPCMSMRVPLIPAM